MKTEKKLTRGLNDLSPLFAQHQKPCPMPAKAPLTIERPPPILWQDKRMTRLVCGTFLAVEELLDPASELRLLNSLTRVFQEVYYLSIAPSQYRYETLARTLPIPPWEYVANSSSIRYFALGGTSRFAYVPEHKFHEIVELKPSLYPSEPDPDRTALVVFDPAFLNDANYQALQFLDHGILVLSSSPEHLVNAYRFLRFCHVHHRSMRFSILVVGQNARQMSDLIYERFSEIVSKFTGCDLGFLGWVDGREIKLNSDILFEEAGSAAQTSSKIRLSEALQTVV